jgi:hypothetical protein
MDHSELEFKRAWEELSFWRDFAVRWKTEHNHAPEPRILEAIDRAESRYARAGVYSNSWRQPPTERSN